MSDTHFFIVVVDPDEKAATHYGPFDALADAKAYATRYWPCVSILEIHLNCLIESREISAEEDAEWYRRNPLGSEQNPIPVRLSKSAGAVS